MRINVTPALAFAILALCFVWILPARSNGETSPDSELADIAMYGVNKINGQLIRYGFSESELTKIGTVHSAAGSPLLGIEASAYIPGFQNIFCFWTDTTDHKNKLLYVDVESAQATVMADDLEGGRVTGAVAVAPATGDITLFRGVDDVVVTPHSNAHLVDNGTIMFRFNAHSLSGVQCMFSKDSSGFDTGGHVQVYLEGGRLKARLQSASASYYISADRTVGPNSWHRVALTFGSGGMRLYLNGVEVGSNAYTGGIATTSGGAGNYEPIVLGASQWASGNLIANNLQYFFAGEIQGFQILDEVPPVSEIARPESTIDAPWTVFAV